MVSHKIGTNRLFLAIPVLLLVLAVGSLAFNFSQTGEWFERSIELKGGTLVTVETREPADIGAVEEILSQSYGKVIVRELRSFTGSGLSVQVDSGIEPQGILEDLESLGIDTSDSSVQTIGPSLGEAFWVQAQISIAMAFIIMGIIVFAIFRSAIPSATVIAAAVSDIIVTIAFMNVLGLEMSLASFAAVLMLIGYSIDTNILLTTRVTRTEGSFRDKVSRAFRTGMTMTLTTMAVLLAVILTTTSAVLFSIASVLFIGLFVDIINTWLMNATFLGIFIGRFSR